MQELVDAFEAFREECIWCCIVFRTHEALFEQGPEQDSLLRKSAPNFFFDYSVMLQEYHVMLVGRLTDPAASRGNNNCTVDYLTNRLAQEGVLTSEISNIADELMAYRKHIKPSRDKLVAHRDLDAVTKGVPHSSWPMQKVLEFHENLNRFCDSVAVQIGVEPTSFHMISPQTFPLIQALRIASRAKGSGDLR
jgi:hypothetical protein